MRLFTYAVCAVTGFACVAAALVVVRPYGPGHGDWMPLAALGLLAIGIGQLAVAGYMLLSPKA